MTINVTRPFLPPFETYERYLRQVWEREWLTNNGPLLNELELQLKKFVGLEHLLFVANGTVALQLAIKALRLEGEVITTPFSFVATASCIAWEGLTPVMVDIDPQSLNIDPTKIEGAITERTSAILATHVYGNPCEVELIQAIADRHGLKVIYDAAHAFGANLRGRSLFAYGDISTTSFHATKLFHTVEGGAVFTPQAPLLKTMAEMRNFGFVTPSEIQEIGINAKNSELHAAMGLAVLPSVPDILVRRRQISERYDEMLDGSGLVRPVIASGCEYNHSYYPVLFPSEAQLLSTVAVLNQHGVYPRRYFYPSLATLPYVAKADTPVANDAAPRVLCLPLYPSLSDEEVDMIARLVKRTLRY